MRQLSTGLRVPLYVANRALMNSPGDITDASFHVLNEWLSQQSSRQEAYVIMVQALLHCGMKQIANEIRMKHQGELGLGNYNFT